MHRVAPLSIAIVWRLTFVVLGLSLPWPYAGAAWAQDEVYVVNASGGSGTGSVTVYPRSASGTAAPIRTITGPTTGLLFPRGLAVDASNNEIFVGDSDTIFVYPRTGDGDVAPLRTLHLPGSLIVNLSLDATNNELVVADGVGAIFVYSRTASGAATPLRTIKGGSTGLGAPFGAVIGVAVDAANNELVVTRGSAGNQNNAILVFNRTADGDVGPIRSITGLATGLLIPGAVAIDLASNELVVSDEGSVNFAAIRVYPRTASGDVAPLRSITGAATGLSLPLGVALDTVNGEIQVVNEGTHSLTVYPRTGTGNVAPLRTLAGAGTGLASPDAMALPQPASAPAATTLVAAVLPNVRAVKQNTLVTVNASIINSGGATALQVGIALATAVPTTFGYQLLDTSVSPPVLVGAPNTPVDIPAGQRKDFVLFMTPSAPFPPTELQFTFAGTNTAPVTVLVGINTLLLLSSATDTPDVVALAGTLRPSACPPLIPPCPMDGIVRIPGVTGTTVFVVSTTNLGIGDMITVTTDTGAFVVPVTVLMCQTDPGTGACLGPLASTLTVPIAKDDTPTFGFFVTGLGAVIPLDPATNRVFVRFHRSDGLIVGGTSVAVITQ
jgi:hypothetical protein